MCFIRKLGGWSPDILPKSGSLLQSFPCCLAGLGLIQIPRFDVQHLLDSRQLVEVMSSYCAASMPVSLLYPHRRQRSQRLDVFHEWFEALMRPYLDSRHVSLHQ
ncbi:LysR substrate-binding domain-containing protein [Pseudomonas veronii]|uniref:LysR substrate-binding domain-containing protein n=1 Tax=Pseudomonas veronii TaxID=76761 RepID=UPI0034E97416